jgi:hypothetical protein
MKNKWRLFLFLTFFVLVRGFGQQRSSGINDVLEKLENIEDILYSITGEAARQGRMVPLTLEIFNDINRNGLFKKLDYYLSSDLNLTGTPERKVRASAGGLIIDNGKIVEIRLPAVNRGEFIRVDDKTKNEESLTIKFPMIEDTLQFNRDTKTDLFYLYSVGGIKVKGPVPYLHIRRIGGPVSQSNAEGQQRGTLGQLSRYDNPAPGQNSPLPLPPGYRLAVQDQFPVFIMERGRLSRNVIVSYIASKGAAMNRQQIDALAAAYIQEAGEEGVNHDIAIAQMCYATSFLNNRPFLATYNYAGLNTDIGISVRGGSSHFNYAEGVRAHIQHLKGYASTVWPRKEIVDRRYNLLVTSGIMGTVTTLDDLIAAWSPYNAAGYGAGIKAILREMYQFSGRI